MIDRPVFLADAQKLLAKLEKDLRARCDDMPEVGQAVTAEYKRAKDAGRTGQTLEEWRADAVTQQAAAWVLSCVFVRFLEDNRLIDPPRISGQSSVVSHQSSVISHQSENRLARARDEHEMFFRANPRLTDREYLLHVFADMAELPGCRGLFDIRQFSLTDNCELTTDNLWWLSPDATKDLLLPFFQRIDAENGRLVHDFTDPSLDTRFLGDLYQDLSEAARKKYALLQTPVFVEEFILARTLEPAVETFGLGRSHQSSVVSRQSDRSSLRTDQLTTDDFRMIDPACGSGHFLLGTFGRLLDHWMRREPATPRRELVQRALAAVHGVDLNPYALAIARFRLLLAAWQACGITSLANAPEFRLNLACGDSLLHGSTTAVQGSLGFAGLHHHYQPEDAEELERLLRPGSYHAVVANPPYITPKDRGLNEKYRERYSACHMKYSLAVPFMQRIFDLACEGGFTGQITANSFMKREFGKKLIEEFFPTIDLTHVIDTSGAFIPGHGTPTVILFGRNRRPVAGTLRTVMGIRGEPTTPDDPAEGQVWTAIVKQIDQPGSQSAFVSVSNSPRENFHRHPWSIGGGGAAELKEHLDEVGETKLDFFSESIGFASFTGTDEVFLNSSTHKGK
ncbi:MAG TPA: BREX-2 system adenine-specific DNA-methyltransferase PglX [Gemmataceae bacterium]|nr:BREX-2 system adenine-specific DNA-methyltransferase PglX [Gemmataceae bacterium]